MKIGILGGGQLARMMILDGLRLGLEFVVYDEKLHSSTHGLLECRVGAFDDPAELKRFAEAVDVVTCEFENVPAKTLEILSDSVSCFPPAAAFSVAQDRIAEKDMLRSLGLKTAPYRAVSTFEELQDAAKELGFPFVLKTRRMGYDGKGQGLVKSSDELQSKWDELGKHSLIAEGFVSFVRELSIIGVFEKSGGAAYYPLVENVHTDGILTKSIAPAPNQEELYQKAVAAIDAIAGHYHYVGVLVVELFQEGDEILVNEIAPRVHNSGHWTIEGSVTSQFENHIRAVAGLPLGTTEQRFESLSVNILSKIPKRESILAIEGAKLHLYNKPERPGRKLGHISFQNTSGIPFEQFIKEKESELAGL